MADVDGQFWKVGQLARLTGKMLDYIRRANAASAS